MVLIVLSAPLAFAAEVDTAAPIAGFAIISTCIGLEVGLINDAFNTIGVEVDAFGIFLNTIPFRFYNILILAFIVITALLAKDFGPIGTLILAALVSFYYSGYSQIMVGEDKTLIQLFTSHPYSFEAIKQAFSASDESVALFQSALFASMIANLMAVGKKIFTLSEAIEVWIDGMKGLFMTGVILILAWSLS